MGAFTNSEFEEMDDESFTIINDFWSDDECLRKVVEDFGVSALKDDVLFYIEAIKYFKEKTSIQSRKLGETVQSLEDIQHITGDGSTPDKWDGSTGGLGHKKCRKMVSSVLNKLKGGENE
ncbi:hypothetical protein BSK59_13595 [Paenibacillus odorifer]|uniref:hypothetical protein n=1 Tax=Paenibacillus odorifer TaxID=189426 RepID=UPI00096BE270|nr:hypothetical protein [Paenibacillus odorifer]OME55505.1 hypothetical protein BSK59_13595 [Paenibacillus odorifer]